MARGLRLRCPRCGEAPLFRTFLETERACPACGAIHQRDRGDWLGSTETALILAMPIAIVAWLALDAAHLDPDLRFALALASFLAAYPFVFRRVRGAWLGLLRAWEGDTPEPVEPGPPAPIEWATFASEQETRRRRATERRR